MNFKKNYLLISILLSLIIFLVSFKNGVFWDNVIFVSKTGNYLFENGLFNWNLPNKIDTGYPLTFAFLNALFWKILGKKLWVSYLLMFLINIGLFYQLIKFINYYIKKNTAVLLAFLLVLVDPTLSSTLMILTPETIQIFLYLLALNSLIVTPNIKLKTTALFLLAMFSFRSMMLCASFFIFDMLNSYLISKKRFFTKENLISYVIASLSGLLFLIWHYKVKGWVFTHENYPWATHREFTSFNNFSENVLIFIHRYIDFGRVFLFLFLIISFIFFGKKIFKSKDSKQLFLLSITATIVVGLVSLFSTNTMGHRYFILSFIAFNLFSFYVFFTFLKKKKIIFLALFLGLITGNLWIYPREISQGWDATLAHLPYYNLRLKAIHYLDKNKISIEKTASFFPNLATINEIDFNGDDRKFTKFNSENKYVFYANIYNLTDEDYIALDKKYTLLKEFNKNNITIQILIKNDTIRR